MRGLVFGDGTDEFGLGAAQVEIAADQTLLDGREGETVLEAYYKFSLIHNIDIQLDLQFIQVTGGLPSAEDAWVGGLRCTVEF